jgi:N-acetylglutamate synthase-like GNAT family acetyltransferase
LVIPKLTAVTIERIRHDQGRQEVIDYLKSHEPEATPALVALTRAAPRRHTKTWVVRDSADGDGRAQIVGVLVAWRYCFDRWNGTLLLEQERFAPELARVLDRSSVWWVNGPAPAVEAVLAHARRARGLIRLWYYSIPPQPPEAAESFDRNSDVAIRPATSGDLERLVELYSHDEHSGGATRRGLRQAVRARLPYTFVADAGGVVVGAVAVPSTEQYSVLDFLVVHPQARGRRIGVALLLHVSVEAVIAGRGICGLRAMTNGLRVSHEDVLAVGDASVWAANDLRPPVRFRGHGRLRRLAERVQGGVIVPPRPEPSPYSVLPEQARTPQPADTHGKGPAD